MNDTQNSSSYCGEDAHLTSQMLWLSETSLDVPPSELFQIYAEGINSNVDETLGTQECESRTLDSMLDFSGPYLEEDLDGLYANPNPKEDLTGAGHSISEQDLSNNNTGFSEGPVSGSCLQWIENFQNVGYQGSSEQSIGFPKIGDENNFCQENYGGTKDINDISRDIDAESTIFDETEEEPSDHKNNFLLTPIPEPEKSTCGFGNTHPMEMNSSVAALQNLLRSRNEGQTCGEQSFSLPFMPQYYGGYGLPTAHPPYVPSNVYNKSLGFGYFSMPESQPFVRPIAQFSRYPGIRSQSPARATTKKVIHWNCMDAFGNPVVHVVSEPSPYMNLKTKPGTVVTADPYSHIPYESAGLKPKRKTTRSKRGPRKNAGRRRKVEKILAVNGAKLKNTKKEEESKRGDEKETKKEEDTKHDKEIEHENETKHKEKSEEDDETQSKGETK